MLVLDEEVRDRERVAAAPEKNDTPILTGYRLFRDYIRPHISLNGKTPAETVGINLGDENKCISLLQDAG